MAKTAMIRVRTETKLKHDVEQIFNDLGLSISEAINLFYHQVVLRRGIPFNIELPNKETVKTFSSTNKNKNIKKFKNKEDMFKELDI